MSSIRQLQASKFKANYISEITVVVDYLKEKVKKNQPLTADEIEEAKAIFNENLQKIYDLDAEVETDTASVETDTASLYE